MEQDIEQEDELPTEKAAQAADLAEAFHNLPQEMYGRGRFNWQITRGMMQWYEQKWPDEHHRYTAMLDKIHPGLREL